MLKVVVAQLPVTFDVAENVRGLRAVLDAAPAGAIVVTPEGSVSGYAESVEDLARVDWRACAEALAALDADAAAARVTLWVGCYRREQARVTNAALCLGEARHRYDKANLATAERSFVTAGSELLPFDCGGVRVGIQMCRELRFPDQWRKLAQRGAQVIAHLNNAVPDAATVEASTWREMLIARAAELQRYVVSANVPAGATRAPTLVIAPSGAVLAEVPAAEAAFVSATLDLDATGSWYLGQYRDEL